jgi:NTE family protein
LALGAGGSRGYAHLGVIRSLERHGIPVDVVSGCSIGSAVAAAYAAGVSLEETKEHIDNASRKALRPAFPWISILSNRGVARVIKELAGEHRFEDLPVPLAIVAVDLVRRAEVVFRRGLIWPTIVGSMAIPGIYPPLRMGKRYLVDGGIINPVPISAATTLGAQVVIGAKLTSSNRLAAGEGRINIPRPFRSPLLHDTVSRALEIMQGHIVEQSAERADITVVPQFRNVEGAGLRDFHRAAEFEAAGEEAVEVAMDELRALLPWVE